MTTTSRLQRISVSLGAWSILASSLLAQTDRTTSAETAPTLPFPRERASTPIPFGDPAWSPYLSWDAPFFPDSQHDPAIATPDAILGQPAGSRVASHDEILAAYRLWAASSERMKVQPYGRTYEGRQLVYAVITSPKNHQRLDEWLASRFECDVPAERDAEKDAAACKDAPAVIWMGYGIHGDEPAPSDAALVMAWHLVSGTSPDVTKLLDECVVVIDPCLNPDGRERIRSQYVQMSGYVTNTDHDAMQRGRWPQGRGNHYLIDMNRDWVAGVTPETRGRWRALRQFDPQVLIDGHEQGPLDTFLMYPLNVAHNPELPNTLIGWQKLLADAAAKAFDKYKWGYYTREWADGWYPGYSDAWSSLRGAIGMLYEQARGNGQPVTRASGEVVSYRESVHREVVASTSHLAAVLQNRAGILADFLRARNVPLSSEYGGELFCVFPNDKPERMAILRDVLDGQGIEYHYAAGGKLLDAVGRLGEKVESIDVPEGTLFVSPRQLSGRLVRAFFGFDPRMPDDYLAKERRDIERRGFGNIYDVTAWNVGMAFDLPCWWGRPDGLRDGAAPAEEATTTRGGGDAYAWAVDGAADGATRFAARAMELGVRVHLGDEPFTAAGRGFARFSLLVRAHENPPTVARLVEEAARWAGVRAYPLETGRSPDEGPDLGGQHFTLLERPRVAILANSPASTTDFGALWHHLDVRLGMPHSILDGLSGDLRRYNVIVAPPGMARELRGIEDWVRAGGTLIAVGSAVNGVIGEDGLIEVVRHRDALEDLASYRAAAVRAMQAGTGEIDAAALWDGTLAPGGESFDSDEDGALPGGEDRDAWMRRFGPEGVILKAHVDVEHWLAAGTGPCVPTFFSGSTALLTKGDCPVRFADGGELRLSGLLWPEARERIRLSAYCTVDRVGAGQVVCFADDPVFRGYFLGTARLFSNAVVYGPGMGTSVPVPR
ncbi:MAG: M14 family zinc carboxypeptidase [Planctomycetota bacterium]